MRVFYFIMALLALVIISFLSFWGGIAERTFNPDNAIAQYERFHDRCAAIQRYEVSLTAQESLLNDAESSDERARIRTNIAGLTAQRQGAISQYNADATKTNVGIFQGRTLPRTLDAGTSTICGEY